MGASEELYEMFLKTVLLGNKKGKHLSIGSNLPMVKGGLIGFHGSGLLACVFLTVDQC